MKILDLVYVERIEGKEKPSYHNVGIIMMKDDGKVSVKMNTLPVSHAWDGWLTGFERKQKEQNSDSGPF